MGIILSILKARRKEREKIKREVLSEVWIAWCENHTTSKFDGWLWNEMNGLPQEPPKKQNNG